MAYVKVAKQKELADGAVIGKRIGDLAIALYRRGDEIYAMEDVCPHAGYPLSAGRFEDCVIECGAHGYRFDVRTGFPPKHGDGFPIPCFPVRVESGSIWADLENPYNLRGPRA